MSGKQAAVSEGVGTGGGGLKDKQLRRRDF